MLLPGGVWRDGACDQRVAFRPLTGALELAVAEAAGASIPDRVTAALAAAMAWIGGRPGDAAAVAGLSIGDRQFLMRRLATHLGLDDLWLTLRCEHCGAPFDIQIRLSALPVKPAGPGFPFATAETTTGPLRLRVPTGADQAAVAMIEDEAAAVAALVDHCILDSGEQHRAFSMEDLARIDAALEAVAPEVATAAGAPCPGCDSMNEVRIDPYLVLECSAEPLFGEIHRLASHYHWNETDILALPHDRRQRYLRLVDRDAGTSH